MNVSVISRLKQLEKSFAPGPSFAFTLKGGGEFVPKIPPFRYLSEHGRRSPNGREIVGVRFDGDMDPLTASIIGTLRKQAEGKALTIRETVERMERKREL